MDNLRCSNCDSERTIKMDLTTMSIEELKALRIKLNHEIKIRKIQICLVVQMIGTVFIIKAVGIKKKDQGVKDIFERYGLGDLSYRNDDEISFLFRDPEDAKDCGYNIDTVTMQLKKILTS